MTLQEGSNKGLVFEFQNPSDRGAIDQIGLALTIAKRNEDFVESYGEVLQFGKQADIGSVAVSALREGAVFGLSKDAIELPVEDRAKFSETYKTSLVLREGEIEAVSEAVKIAPEFASTHNSIHENGGNDRGLNLPPKATFDRVAGILSEGQTVLLQEVA